jgi:hypothetical protein
MDDEFEEENKTVVHNYRTNWGCFWIVVFLLVACNVDNVIEIIKAIKE